MNVYDSNELNGLDETNNSILLRLLKEWQLEQHINFMHIQNDKIIFILMLMVRLMVYCVSTEPSLKFCVKLVFQFFFWFFFAVHFCCFFVSKQVPVTMNVVVLLFESHSCNGKSLFTERKTSQKGIMRLTEY